MPGETGQQAWSWSMQIRWPSSNASRPIAQAYPWASSIWPNFSGVRPKRLSLYTRFQRDLASGVARSASTPTLRQPLPVLGQGCRCPAI